MRGVFAVLLPALTAAASAAMAGTADEKKACVAAVASAQALRAQSKLTAAREQLVICGREACPAAIRKDCQAWLPDVEGGIPTVVLGAKLDGKDVTDVRVLEGERVVAESLDGKALALDPGPHKLRFERAGASLDQDVVIVEGEKNRKVAVEFVTVKEKPVAPPPPAAPAPTPRAEIPTATWVLGGVGVVGLAGFAYFGLKGKSEVNALRESCAPRCGKDESDAARRKYLYADIALGVSVVAIGVAVVIAVTSSGPARETPKTALEGSVLPGGGYLGCRVTF